MNIPIGERLDIRVEHQRGENLTERFVLVRAQSEKLCAPLAVEDFGVQPMVNASPPKWHLAHTSWFFETFLLKPYLSGYTVFDRHYEYLFNSYYNGVGEPFPRQRRGMLSRPTVQEVYAYRHHVDEAIAILLSESPVGEVANRIELGINHEQQHQELLLTDIKVNLGHNPLFPAYREDLDHERVVSNRTELTFSRFPAARVWIGAEGGFCFDNELPRHEVLIDAFALADRVVSNAEYLQFIEDDGYLRPELWLSDGWSLLKQGLLRVQHSLLCAPLYWGKVAGQWLEYRLNGRETLEMNAPVTHVSYYEADAYARWAGHRLATEQEWETAARGLLDGLATHQTERTVDHSPFEGNFIESGFLHPSLGGGAANAENPIGCTRLFGDVWEWTASPYIAYPGYRTPEGALGEYNGKFMSNQMVLRGGSCATPRNHVRLSYRNFFYPSDRWQFTGIRLARSL